VFLLQHLGQSSSSLASLVNAKVQWLGFCRDYGINKWLDHWQSIFCGHSPAFASIRSSGLAERVAAPGLSTTSEELGEVASLNSALQGLVLWIVGTNI
jgi:hypothetical protein